MSPGGSRMRLFRQLLVKRILLVAIAVLDFSGVRARVDRATELRTERRRSARNDTYAALCAEMFSSRVSHQLDG